MKHLSVLLSSVAVVVVSILVYDRVFRSPEAPTVVGDGLTPYDQESGSRPFEPRGPRTLTARMADQDRRMSNLEGVLASLREDVARIAKRAAAVADKSGDESPKFDPDAPLDEDELAVLRLQMEELTRRKEARRQGMMVRRKLEQLGVTFSESEHAALMKRMVDFQVAVSELWTRVREEAIDDKDRIASDYTALTDAAAGDVRRLLPAEKAAAVIKGFLSTGPAGHRAPR